MTSPAHGSDSDGWSHHGIGFDQARDANQHWVLKTCIGDFH